MRASKGVSLLEILIVIAVISILAASLGLGIRQLVLQARLSEAVATVEREIDDARRETKRLDRAIVVDVSEAGGAWRIVADGRVQQLPSGVTVASGATNFTLDPPFGTYAGAPLSLVLDSRGVQATVTVTGVLAQTVVTQ